MQEKTLGIILHSTKYADSNMILTVYTFHFGRVSYIVNGIHRKKSAVRPAVLQPLSVVEMDVVHQQGKEIQRIRELRPVEIFHKLSSDPIKNSVGIFIAELLYRVIKSNEPDERLFEFLYTAVGLLDKCGAGVANFHLIFMCRLARHLGIEPNAEGGEYMYLDLMNGVFQCNRPLHVHYISRDEATFFRQMLEVELAAPNAIVMSRERRNRMLEILMEYYRLHIPDFRGVNSLSVLRSLFE